MTKVSKPRSKDLQSIRANINSIDRQIHDLLILRSKRVEDVLSAKRGSKLSVYHPRREFQSLQERAAWHKGSFASLQALAIFRLIVGGGIAIQAKDFRLLHGKIKSSEFLSLARGHFGPIISAQEFPSSLQALSHLAQNPAAGTVALEHREAWWLELLDHPQIKIVATLPIYKRKQEAAGKDGNPLDNPLGYIAAVVPVDELPDGDLLVVCEAKPCKDATLMDQQVDQQTSSKRKLWLARKDSLASLSDDACVIGCLPPVFLL